MQQMHHQQTTREIHVPDASRTSGVRLQVADIGSPDAPVMLLLHGYTDSAYSFSRIAPMLAENWRLLIPDQRGHGDSEAPSGSYSPAQLAEDGFAVLDTFNIGSATIVGHSMGSFVAQRMAARQPERLEALVLIGSAMAPRNEVTLGLLEEIEAMGEVETIDSEFIRAFQRSTLCRTVPDEFFEAVVHESKKLTARLWGPVLRALVESVPVTGLNQLSCPVWVVGGSEDAVFSVEEQRALAAAIPNCELTILEGVGHGPHWEVRQEFSELLRRFCLAVPR